MRDNDSAAQTVRECLRAYNRCTVDWVDTYYAENVEWVELPTAAMPSGRGGNRAALRAFAERGLALFPDRQMTIRNLVADGNLVAAELNWQGTAATRMGDVEPGATIRLCMASFFTVSDGLIVKQTDYCVPGSRG